MSGDTVRVLPQVPTTPEVILQRAWEGRTQIRAVLVLTLDPAGNVAVDASTMTLAQLAFAAQWLQAMVTHRLLTDP